MWPILQFPADLVTFTEEIHNGKLHFLYNVAAYKFLANAYNFKRNSLLTYRVVKRQIG